MQKFIHLRTFSSYSLSQGALKIKDFVSFAKETQSPAIAITDINNLFGAFEFSLSCTKNSIQPILGAHVDLQYSESCHAGIILLAQSQEGFQNLSKIISKIHLQEQPASWETLASHSKDIICLSGGSQGVLGKPIEIDDFRTFSANLLKLKDIFKENLYLEIHRENDRNDSKHEHFVLKSAIKEKIAIVATTNCFFAKKEMHEAHTALLCMKEKGFMHHKDSPQSNPNFYLRPPEEMQNLFADLPEAIENTITIARRCSFYLTPQKPRLPKFPKSEGMSDGDFLRKIAENGLKSRINDEKHDKNIPEHSYRERLEYELEVITSMGFSGYFLILSDIIQWAKSQNIPVGPARGSGAGSLVAWAIAITEVDSLHFELPFERFLNPERISMPDFDIDFCQERRNEVITYVQKLYSNAHVAQIITFGTLQSRGVLRDVGRVYQLPYPVVDDLCKKIPNPPGKTITLQQALEENPELKEKHDSDEKIQKIFTIAMQLEGLHRHASTHAAGIIISAEPLIDEVPLYKDPNSSIQVTQFSMKYAEMSGLVKFDFLGLKTLSVIEKTINLIKKDKIKFEKNQINIDDKKTFNLISRGLSGGVFQLESSGMQELLKGLRPDCLNDLIAIVALYRPGPMENIPTFIARKHGQEPITYLTPLLEPILEESYGIPIYQEQVMRIAQKLAGYTMGEADLLRRAMGKKIPEEMAAQKKVFLDGCKKNNVDETAATTLFDQISKFAGYAFNKCHAASYAIISFQTAYLKAHFPAHFLAASLSFDFHQSEKIAEHKKSLVQLGLKLLPPCIKQSDSLFTVENQNVRYGLESIKNVGKSDVQTIIQQRVLEKFDHPDSIFHALLRANVNKRSLEHIVRSSALHSIEPNLRLVEAILEDHKKETHDSNNRPVFRKNLFDTPTTVPDSRKQRKVTDYSLREKAEHEISVLGTYMRFNPLNQHTPLIKHLGLKPIHQIPSLEAHTTSGFVGVVHSVAVVHKNNAKPTTVFKVQNDISTFTFFLYNTLGQQALSYSKLDVVQMQVSCKKNTEGQKRLILTSLSHLASITSSQSQINVYCYSKLSVAEVLNKIAPYHTEAGSHTLKIHTPPVTFDLSARFFLNSEIQRELANIPSTKIVSEN